MERFRNTLEDCGLEDLGCVGDIFTWRNHHYRAAEYIKERLDRAVACNEWRGFFPLVRVINGDPRHSDHRTITVDCGEKERCSSCFAHDVLPKFEAKWLEEEGCWEKVESAWTEAMEAGDANVIQIQKKILGELHNWDRNVLGELERRISKVRKELERCRRGQLNQENVNREHVLRYKLERLEDQLHIYWKQRAHTTWLTKGDRNTKFFHASASERKRINYIKSLHGDDGGVVTGRRLKPFIINHYKNLYSSYAGQRTEEILNCVHRRISRHMNETLLRTFTGEEIEEALRSIGDLKAPGPDGISSVFYKRFWSLVFFSRIRKRFAHHCIKIEKFEFLHRHATVWRTRWGK
jgi:hypothetical protein